MDVTTLTALVIARNRDDRDGGSPDGPWALESPRWPRGRGPRTTLAGLLLALAARIVRRRREAAAPLAPVTTN